MAILGFLKLSIPLAIPPYYSKSAAMMLMQKMI